MLKRQTRYTPKFSKDTYKVFGLLEAEGEDKKQPAEGEDNLDAILGGGAPAPAAGDQPPMDQPPADDFGMDMGGEPEQSDEEKEAEKVEEQEISGRISNILSDISDKLGPETLRFYQEVEAKAIEHLKELDMSPEEQEEFFSNLNDIGLKIITNSKKNNFIDRDSIVYVAILEGSLDIKSKMEEPEPKAKKKPEKEDEDEE